MLIGVQKFRKKCVKKGYIWNSAKCARENGKYLGSIIDDSVITHDEIIETTKGILTKTTPKKSISTNFNKK